MATATQPPAWEASAQSKHTTINDRLPSEVVNCLQNARFLHLATCTHNIPHVSLMNYTYLPSHPFPASSTLPSGPTVIMTTNPVSKKTANLVDNPHVSLLVHEWVSSRPSNASSTSNATGAGARDRSPTAAPRSSLAAMLMEMNSAAVSSISATINGDAHFLPVGSEEERWCKEQHLANNTFGENGGTTATATAAVFGSSGAARTADADPNGGLGDGGRGCYIEDQDVRVVVVKIRDGRISDWKGGVKDFVLADATSGEGALANGV